jgi:CRP/FNR family transcriptional regulator, cyclic AMP receptor protein
MARALAHLVALVSPRPVPADASAGTPSPFRRSLLESNLFRGLPLDVAEAIAGRLRMVQCETGTTLIDPEGRGERLYIVKHGRARLYRLTSEGKKLVIGIAGPGATFGELSLLNESMAGTFAEAVDDCTFCVMSDDVFRSVVATYPSFGVRIIEYLGQRLHDAEAALEHVAFHSIPARTARVLLDRADSEGHVEGFSHQDLAEMVGTSRESVTRTLLQFKAEGALTIHRRCIALKDVARLTRYADSS